MNPPDLFTPAVPEDSIECSLCTQVAYLVDVIAGGAGGLATRARMIPYDELYDVAQVWICEWCGTWVRAR